MDRDSARALALQAPTAAMLREAISARRKKAGLGDPSIVNPSLTVIEALGILDAAVRQLPQDKVVVGLRGQLLAENVYRECL